jgi:hypothetical protein
MIAIWSGVGTGLLYGVAALAIKALSGILVRHQAAGIAARLVSSPYLYALAGCLAVGMPLYQAALQACRASVLIPTSAVTGSVYLIIAGTLTRRLRGDRPMQLRRAFPRRSRTGALPGQRPEP